MSLGKFFVFAILLPMATIYLTLTFKEKNDNLLVDTIESNQFINAANFNQDDNISVQEVSEYYHYDDQGNLVNSEIEDNIVGYDTTASLPKADKQRRNASSIEQLIKNNKNYTVSSIVEKLEIENIKKSSVTQKPKVTTRGNKNNSAVKKQAKLNTRTIHKQPLPKISNSKEAVKNKIVSTKRIKVSSKRQKSNATTFSRKKVTLSKKQNQLSPNTSKSSFNQTKNNPQFKKQVIKTQVTNPKNRRPDNYPDYFDGVFDDDTESEDETDFVSNQSNPNSTDTVESQEFTSNPCSGRSSRYIARCRK